MREIFYKAKRIDNGEWVYWNIFGELCRESGKRTRLAVQKGATISYYDYIHQIVQLIDANTVCQFTGLTDKNGNKIWENDIVHLFGIDTIRNYNWKAVVKFGNPNGLYSWGYQLKPIGHFEYNEDILCWVDMEEANIYCEVIGNLFDNKELLEE